MWLIFFIMFPILLTSGGLKIKTIGRNVVAAIVVGAWKIVSKCYFLVGFNGRQGGGLE